MTGIPGHRRSRLLYEVRDALLQGGHQPSFEDGLVKVGSEEIPLEDFEANFTEALNRLLSLVDGVRGRSIFETYPPFVSFGPTMPERPGRYRYGKDIGEMSG